MHLVDPPQLICQIPSKKHHKLAVCKEPRQGPYYTTVSPAPGRGEDKVHNSLTVAPGVGWGHTSGLTVALPTNTSYSRQHRGSALKFGATAGTIQNDLSNITDHEFRIIVIKLIARLEKSIHDSRESITT